MINFDQVLKSGKKDDPKQSVFHIHGLGRRASAARLGIGDELMSKISSYCKDLGLTMMLEVRETNRVALDLYEKWGFAACGIKKDYYSYPRENAVCMKRSFSAALA